MNNGDHSASIPPIAKYGILVAIILLAMATPRADSAYPPNFTHLKSELVRDGFDQRLIESLYTHPADVYDPKSVSLFFIHSEAKLNYKQFSSRKNINRARDYMETHHQSLKVAQERYNVDKEIITAIILVETKLGTYLGRSYIFRTLSTMAALADAQIKERLWNEIPAKRRLDREAYEKKVRKKSQWAYRELKALLRYGAREQIDITAIRGSYAGAMGISQFMPSNALTLAQDGNRDGKIDLFDHADAIMSVAAYLEHHGWRPGLTKEKAQKVIMRYNYSRYYATTIQKVATKLKG